ncbi:MAG: NAD-dependent epimerase/dehydratase family protein [Acidobacteriota bacterium]|nr:NAD-dependent epimerase/dehydratase family protein [Acidobacteriota bacterium]
MKKVLVTGANGFTGRVLLETLAGSEWEVIPMTQVETGLKNEIVIDFRESMFLHVLKNTPRVDAVVHLAARPGWDGCSLEEMIYPNIVATSALINWAKRRRSYLVFASAALIAGTDKSYITPELGVKLNTHNDYLYTKWVGEDIARAIGIKHSILRISGIFGKGGPSHLGINNAIAGALLGKPPVRYGDGNIKRNYIYVKDLCNIIKFCLDHKIEGWHLVGGSQVNTMAEMLQTICDILLPGAKPEIRPDNNSGAHDQIVEPSPLLPQSRSFSDAVRDIKQNTEQTIT